MSSDAPDYRLEDVLEVAQRALTRANGAHEEIDELRDDVADLTDRLVGAELRLSEIDDSRDYRSLSRDEKIGKVREYAFERAADGRGRSLDYDDVRHGCFDGEPSRDHCYDLMRWAADADGFEYQQPSGANYRLVVDPDRVRRSRSGLLSATTRAAEGGH